MREKEKATLQDILHYRYDDEVVNLVITRKQSKQNKKKRGGPFSACVNFPV